MEMEMAMARDERARLMIRCPENRGLITEWCEIDPLEQRRIHGWVGCVGKDPQRSEQNIELIQEGESLMITNRDSFGKDAPRKLVRNANSEVTSNFSCVSLGRSKIVIVGGEDSMYTFLNTAYLKDFGDDDPWEPLPPMILRRREPLAFVYRNKIYAIGGTAYNSKGLLPHPFGEVFDTASSSKKWVPLKQLPDYYIPRKMEHVSFSPPLSSAILQDKTLLFTVGAIAITLDLANEEWNLVTEKHPMLWRYMGPSVVKDGILYVCYGKSLLAYDLVNGSWSPCKVLNFSPRPDFFCIFSINHNTLCVFCCYATFSSGSPDPAFYAYCVRFEVQHEYDRLTQKIGFRLSNLCTSPTYSLNSIPSHCVLLDGTPNDEEVESSMLQDVHNVGSEQHSSNSSRDVTCVSSHSDGDWTCPRCGNVNIGFIIVCRREQCGGQRPLTTLDKGFLVDDLLRSLALEDYSLTFRKEEIDMTALMQMNDEDLKAHKIPMGPRKKIISALGYLA